MRQRGKLLGAFLRIFIFWFIFNLVHFGAYAVDPSRDLMGRSVSSSRQFIVYCQDARLRMAVTSFVEEAKESVLQTLGTGDQWKIPIVINFRASRTTEPGRPLSSLAFLKTDAGPSIQIEITLRTEQFKQIAFPQLIVRAVLLDIAYRTHPPGDGEHFNEPPSWLVEGMAQRINERNSSKANSNAALFEQMIEAGRLPKIRDFLGSNVSIMDSTSRSIHASCASALIQMLSELPDGSASLFAMVRRLGESTLDPTTRLLTYFTALKGSEASLEKWWTLGIARLAASERYLGLTVPETNSKLTTLLSFQIITDEKQKTSEMFTLADYAKMAKIPAAKPALEACQNSLAGLMAQSHPLMRPVVNEYQRILMELSKGNLKNINEELEAISAYRLAVVQRAEQIADYLNWYEATQSPQLSGAFDSYLKAAAEIQNQAPLKRDDPVSLYLDQVEREFE
jgi:hypothetical protein